MRNHKAPMIVLCAVVLCGLVLVSTALSDVWNKKTVLTINQPLRIPGVTLAPGTYVFKLADSQSNRHIVQVLSEDETKVYATILAIPNYRLEPSGDSKFGFWEMPQGSPQALRSWFYPGDNFGQEFAYPKTEATEIAAQVKEEVPTIAEEEQSKLAAVPSTTEESKEAVTPSEPAQAAPQTIEPAPSAPSEDTAAQAKPEEAQPTEEPTELPKTASPFPLIGMIGLLSFASALGIRLIRRRIS